MKKATVKVTKELIGHVGVDSGQLMVVDPCYVFKQMTQSEADELYKDACNATKPHGMVLCSGIQGEAAAFSSGYGDGVYPVYAYKNEEGRIIRVEILM